MLKSSVLFSCASAVAAVGDGYWCVTKHPSDLSALPGKLVSFRGDYRDFSLFVETTKGGLSECDEFKPHIIGDDGMWVIEEPNVEIADKTKDSLRAAGLPIYYDAGASFIVGGGTDVPTVSGLDGCGADEDTSFIPVPSHTISPPLLSIDRVNEWKHSGQVKDPFVESGVAAVSEASLIKSVQSLQEFYTRNSYSETINQAKDFIAAQLTNMGYHVDFMEFRSDMSANIIATLPGAEYDEWVVAGAHYDSRSTNSSSGVKYMQFNSIQYIIYFFCLLTGTMRAPGADDNGSGTSAMLEIASIIKNMHDTTPFKRGNA